MIAYSEFTLASLEKVNSLFGEYFGSRIGDIVDLQAKIDQILNTNTVGCWKKIIHVSYWK